MRHGFAGDPTFTLTNDLAAVEGLGATGIAVRAAADTWTTRTITGMTGQIAVVDGSGASGNPTISLPTTVFLGTPGGSPAAGALTGPDASGLNIAGASLELIGGKGTGNAAPGQVVVRYPLVGASGSTLQSLGTDRFPPTTAVYTATSLGNLVSNTTAETSILAGATLSAGSTLTLQGGVVAVGTEYRLYLVGSVTTTGTPTLQLRLKFGSTTIADTTPFTAPNNANGLFVIEGNIFVSAIGVSGGVRASLVGHVTAATSGAVMPVFFTSNFSFVTIDLTVNQTIDVTAQWGAASVSNNLQFFRGYIERIR